MIQASCGAAPDTRDSHEKVRALLEEGDYHGAMKLLPEAMAESEREAAASGHSVAVMSGSLDAHVLQSIAESGDAHWGRILDDPDIPHHYKTGLLFDIIESRLGKGSVYEGGGGRYVVPASGPVDLDKPLPAFHESPGPGR
jgi:hypothetical protein